MKQTKLGACIASAILVALAAFFVWQVSSWLHRPKTLPSAVDINLPAGTTLWQLSHQLRDKGLLDHELPFSLFVKLIGKYPNFKAGNYRFVDHVTPRQIVEAMTAGDTHHEVMLELTIPEGFELSKVIDRISVLNLQGVQGLVSLTEDSGFLKSFGIPAPNLEGYIYPATYRFYDRMPTTREVVERMVGEFFRRLPKNYVEQVEDMGLSLHEAVIFASLIEKETAVDAERPMVSEVIWRRLRDRVPLGIDAALIYGIQDYRGNIRTVHLKDRRNPYNTRIHRGLPPSPIGSVSLKSLAAVLEPTDEGFYYYVLRDDDRLRHRFSKTLEEHNHHVRRLVRAQRADRR